jgi:transcriptional regulator with XRE-family HTH domain
VAADDELRDLGAAIRDERRRRRWTQRELARRAGVSLRKIGDIERAETRTTTDDIHIAIEIAFGWPPGSIARLRKGLPVKADPVLERLVALWPRLEPEERRMLLARAERLLGEDGP